MQINLEAITPVLGKLNTISVIWLQFPKDPKLITHVKSFRGRQFCWNTKCWYLPDTPKNRDICKLPRKMLSEIVEARIPDINKTALKALSEHLQLKALSINTQKTYLSEFSLFLIYLGNQSVNNVYAPQLKSYFLHCLQDLKHSENTVHSRIKAIKYFYENVLKRQKMLFDIPRPKKKLLLPKVLAKEEIIEILNVTANQKHLLMLSLCYGMGLRVSEIVNLKRTDIDLKRMQVFISAAKGKKDRYANLPQFCKKLIISYLETYNPMLFLFEGQHREKYTTRSVQAVFANAKTKAGIEKSIGIHSLRHSFATHLLENGTDISLIQKLLGHNDVKTTLIYTQVGSNVLQSVKSPLDY